MTTPQDIDLIEFFEKYFSLWNQEQVLGKNWEFAAVLTDDAVNRYKLREEDNMVVFLTNLNITNTTQLQQGRTINFTERWGFNLRVVECDHLARNNYNEIPNYEIASSRWAKKLKPLKDLLRKEDVLKFCQVYGISPFRIVGWSMTPLINWQDNNYTGWDIRATIEFEQYDN